LKRRCPAHIALFDGRIIKQCVCFRHPWQPLTMSGINFMIFIDSIDKTGNRLVDRA
jgi:hypothetical protein